MANATGRIKEHRERKGKLEATRPVMEKAKEAAASPPNTIKTDKLRSYVKAIKEVFPETLHFKSRGIRPTLNNMSKRLQITYHSRVKTMRGMDSVKTEKLALTACMRKLLTILNSMVKSSQRWNPNGISY